MKLAAAVQPRLSEQDPTGNVGLMAFRIVERIAMKHMTADEWNFFFRPCVEDWIDRTFNPRRQPAPRKRKR